MAIPQPMTLAPGVGHINYLIYTHPTSIKDDLNTAKVGTHFNATAVTAEENVFALLVDPRFSTNEVASYIVELGGTIYSPPEEE